MFDISFFKAIDSVKRRIVSGDFGPTDAATVESALETHRAREPKVFNVETTNYCNMTCIMCPRTTLMTRKNIWIDDAVFERVLDQIKPWATADLEDFWTFVRDRWNVRFDRPDENAFYFHIVSRCLILHGYGEPLLDKKIVQRVQSCSARGIPTYFSCVPANITVERCRAVMAAGLTVLKFSMDALNDELQKKIRGKRNNFSKAFDTILDILEMKKTEGFDTLIVPTMIALSNDDEARAMHRQFLDLWTDKDVFAYVKSQDNRWYFEDQAAAENRSHYESQYCEFPWTSLTVMADGNVVPCTQDYDVEMVLGNVMEQSLEEIWNGDRYRDLRHWHVTGRFPPGHKCAERCDQKKVCGYLGLAPATAEPQAPPRPAAPADPSPPAPMSVRG
ncbi:radical SAM/SPASM domain-containing protein [Roseospira visakhapatnamensis]|uniref:Radical SAM protein with 4Fe4S-binding SPASM domain n=1 Tax=Roseospira visakhapatnamensis TaxID=390880 RepID=A0A7W6W9R4_9PROT|nr:radical SAM/SPASM domain-containing protein [Roseospira visakhapatnamensis]MBB4266194.1 radical SAM protein with 4Fe4S-binding SPASM domain [Roseospira visakhapatnamensis]